MPEACPPSARSTFPTYQRAPRRERNSSLTPRSIVVLGERNQSQDGATADDATLDVDWLICADCTAPCDDQWLLLRESLVERNQSQGDVTPHDRTLDVDRFICANYTAYPDDHWLLSRDLFTKGL